MNKYIYLVGIVLLHILWLFWMAYNNIWDRDIQIRMDNMSPGAIGYVPLAYKMSKILFYIYSIGILVAHGLFISKSKSRPLTKFIIEVISLFAIVAVIIIFFMTATIRTE